MRARQVVEDCVLVRLTALRSKPSGSQTPLIQKSMFSRSPSFLGPLRAARNSGKKEMNEAAPKSQN